MRPIFVDVAVEAVEVFGIDRLLVHPHEPAQLRAVVARAQVGKCLRRQVGRRLKRRVTLR